MAATSFADRVARIESSKPAPEFNPIRFAGTAPARRPVRRASPDAGRNLATMALGTLAGGLVGVLVQGAVMAGSPWGPGTVYGPVIGMIGLGGLLLSLPMALVSVYLRRRRPGFFFFAAAYAIAAISVALM